MNFTLEWIVVGLGAFFIAVYYAVETWLHAWRQYLPSPLARALYCAGADPKRLASPAVAREIALAEQRCPACPVSGSCREWLESGSSEGYRSFCPNAALVEHLASRAGR